MTRKQLVAARRHLKLAAQARVRERVLSPEGVPTLIVLAGGLRLAGEDARRWWPYLVLAGSVPT